MKCATVVFSGPSLTPEDQAVFPEFSFRGPVEEGDLLRLLLTGDVAQIGLIDGYFGDRRAVSHKEILLAMSKGVMVVGAASMGALRAAELDSYGMIGVGEIYRQYRSGLRTDDGDVAVAHGPAELGFPATSVPIVDVQATCEALIARRRLAQHVADRIIRAARDQYFGDRTWHSITRATCADDSSAEEMARLLAEAEVKAKRLDALKALTNLRETKDARPMVGAPSPPLTYTFRRDLARAQEEIKIIKD